MNTNIFTAWLLRADLAGKLNETMMMVMLRLCVLCKTHSAVQIACSVMADLDHVHGARCFPLVWAEPSYPVHDEELLQKHWTQQNHFDHDWDLENALGVVTSNSAIPGTHHGHHRKIVRLGCTMAQTVFSL